MNHAFDLRAPRVSCRASATIALLVAFAPGALAAQVEVSSSLAFNSQYQMRGLTTTNRAVVQSDLLLAIPVRGGSVSIGAWASFEGGRYGDPERHISENGGERAGLAEYDLRVQAARRIGHADLTIGAMSYAFPNTRGTTREANTAEAFAILGFDSPLSPSVGLWYDVAKIRGSYTQVAIAHDVASVSLAFIAGVNLGQSVGDGGVLGYYEASGLTHFEISAGRRWSMGALGITTSAHLILGRDARTRVTAPGVTGGAKFWFGTTLSWSGRPGRGAREVPSTEQESDTQPR